MPPPGFHEDFLVVDVGNTRLKMGWCHRPCLLEWEALPRDDPQAWQRQIAEWRMFGRLAWAISGVDPERLERFADWLRQRGDIILKIDSPSQLPLKTTLEHPERAGIDRLLNAVGVNKLRREGVPAAVVDAGTAVTVDYVDEQGVFRGGAILPGLRLMAQSLHDYTALLPVVDIASTVVLPATTTVPAVQSGILCALRGAVREVIRHYQALSTTPLSAYFGGGDGALLGREWQLMIYLFRGMTLEGMHQTVRNLS